MILLATRISVTLAHPSKTYRTLVEENGPEPKLPGLGLTNDQLFFIKFGHFLCRRTRTLTDFFALHNAGYPTNELRVNVTLMNFAEFSRVFNCGPETRMNPPSKCFMWWNIAEIKAFLLAYLSALLNGNYRVCFSETNVKSVLVYAKLFHLDFFSEVKNEAAKWNSLLLSFLRNNTFISPCFLYSMVQVIVFPLFTYSVVWIAPFASRNNVARLQYGSFTKRLRVTSEFSDVHSFVPSLLLYEFRRWPKSILGNSVHESKTDCHITLSYPATCVVRNMRSCNLCFPQGRTKSCVDVVCEQYFE